MSCKQGPLLGHASLGIDDGVFQGRAEARMINWRTKRLDFRDHATFHRRSESVVKKESESYRGRHTHIYHMLCSCNGGP
jgi:hypothetical protein